MTLDEIKADLSLRLEKARDSHREQRQSERPDIRAKEAAWGKMVAYAHALKLINEL